ncbi:MAG: FliG C-terminal domain-containing protein [Pseudomonadota bacterium]
MSVPALTPALAPARGPDSGRPVSPQGLTRSALLMRALGARASAVWSQLSPQEAEQLSTAMQDLPDDDSAEMGAVRAYVQAMQTGSADHTAAPTTIWTHLSTRDGNTLASMIQSESPQVIALILSRLSPDAAANTVRVLPRAIATDALKRLLTLGEVHPAAITALERALSQQVDQASDIRLTGGHEHVARIFDQLDSQSEEKLLASLNTAEPGSGEKIRALMFTFADLAGLDAASLQTILGSVDRAVLTLALKGAPEPVAAAFFGNMTQRAADLIREEMQSVGPVRRSEIDAARTEILALARTLVKRGDILVRDSDDELIE